MPAPLDRTGIDQDLTSARTAFVLIGLSVQRKAGAQGRGRFAISKLGEKLRCDKALPGIASTEFFHKTTAKRWRVHIEQAAQG